MKHHAFVIALAFTALALLPAPPVQAQAPPAPPLPAMPAQPAPPKPAAEKAPPAPPADPAAPRTIVPLKLNVVVSRYQNDKKVSSLPYSISAIVTGNLRERVSLRTGAQVPYATTTASEGKPVPGYSYRDVGISIDAIVTLYEAGTYRLDLTVDDTSISTANQVQGAPSIGGVPVFKSFRAQNSVLLKDGQTAQLMTAADPISGETMRIDVTLAVVK